MMYLYGNLELLWLDLRFFIHDVIQAIYPKL